jgi:hypothetical protein
MIGVAGRFSRPETTLILHQKYASKKLDLFNAVILMQIS